MSPVVPEHAAGSGRPLVFAHRGGWFDKRNRHNSLEAFSAALGYGIDLESDVRLSADRQPMLVHDPVVWYAFVPLVVGWMRSSWLRWFGIPALDDLYRTLGTGYELSLDIKVERAAGPAIEVARRWDAVDRLWLVHDDLMVLDRLRAADADVHLVHENRLAELARIGVAPDVHLRTLADHHIDAANTHWQQWTPDLLAAAHDAGVLAFGSLVANPRQMGRAIAVGLDGIYVDHIEAYRAALLESDS